MYYSVLFKLHSLALEISPWYICSYISLVILRHIKLARSTYLLWSWSSRTLIRPHHSPNFLNTWTSTGEVNLLQIAGVVLAHSTSTSMIPRCKARAHFKGTRRCKYYGNFECWLHGSINSTKLVSDDIAKKTVSDPKSLSTVVYVGK